MVLAADAGGLVAAERGVGRVLVVAVGPHAAGLDRAAHPVGPVGVARPDAGAEAVERVVGDLERLGVVGERGHREHRAEDLLLEDPHLVVALEDGRLEVVAAVQLAAELGAVAADQQLGALLQPDLAVALDLLELRRRDLRRRASSTGRAGGPGGSRAIRCQAALHELVVDRLVDQRARRAGADLALVEGVEHEPLDRLVEELVVLGHHVGEEDVRRLAAELGRRRDQVLRGVLHDQPAGRGLAGEGDLRDPLVGRKRLADLGARAVDDVDHARRDDVLRSARRA